MLQSCFTLIAFELSILLALAIFDRIMSCLVSFLESLEFQHELKERKRTLSELARVFMDAIEEQNQ